MIIVLLLEAWNIFPLLDLRVSSLRRGHANLLCIVPMLMDDPRRESNTRPGTYSLWGFDYDVTSYSFISTKALIC